MKMNEWKRKEEKSVKSKVFVEQEKRAGEPELGSRQWVGQKTPEAIICLPAKNSTVCLLFAYCVPTVCLVCTYCVRSLCLLCTFFLSSVWNKEESI